MGNKWPWLDDVNWASSCHHKQSSLVKKNATWDRILRRGVLEGTSNISEQCCSTNYRFSPHFHAIYGRSEGVFLNKCSCFLSFTKPFLLSVAPLRSLSEYRLVSSRFCLFAVKPKQLKTTDQDSETRQITQIESEKSDLIKLDKDIHEIPPPDRELISSLNLFLNSFQRLHFI